LFSFVYKVGSGAHPELRVNFSLCEEQKKKKAPGGLVPPKQQSVNACPVYSVRDVPG